ncbi:hypothetical protein [Aminipila luticellarii]|uniref:Uncharacterized protein n=1 Tax=Aminipila luticellarii TaxID=2507160 RepID=A0A410PUM8_9FIRM|nr:hypothetical protein [Aminipila luticellarii]QAT42624.1 hypothetical protein EQM06_04955 [Aminipila luticellarii]
MNKRVWGIFLLLAMLVLLGACGSGDKQENERSGTEKALAAQADKLIKEKLIASYEEMGIDIKKYEVSSLKLAEQVPYSQGGSFDYYKIAVRLEPENSEQIKQVEKRDQIKITCDEAGWIIKNSGIGNLYISAYNDGKELYEFLWIREGDLPKDEKGKPDFKAFTEYRYEQLSAEKVVDEYTLKWDDIKISIGQNDKGRLPLTKAKITKEDPGDLMRSFTRYREIWKTKEICAETYCYFERHYEPVLRMATTSPKVKTNRGIGVGNTAEQLFDAYGADQLVFSSKSFGGQMFSSFAEEQGLLQENEEWTCYGFTGKDDTIDYIAFYMREGKVCAVEMGTGFDYKPFQKTEMSYPLEVEPYINDHMDEPGVMKYDVVIPRVKDSVQGSESLNALIQLDFQDIIDCVQNGRNEPFTESGMTYPWIRINYSISTLEKVAVLNIFTTYSSALGTESKKMVHSYYYDTTCGARMSEEAALYRMGYPKETIEQYFVFQYPEAVHKLNNGAGLINQIIFYFDQTGEPKFIMNERL